MNLKRIIVLAFGIVQVNLFAVYGFTTRTVHLMPFTTPTYSGGDTTKKAPINWFNLDPTENKVPGISTEKAYQVLKNKPSKTIIVGVIDSGVDVDHEDLKGKVWVNEDEIPGNGIDDDKNGYIDDVNGWNFIGGKDGKDVNFDSYELTREYVRLRKKFEGAKASKISKKDQESYALYTKVKEDFEKKMHELQQQNQGFQQFFAAYKQAQGALKAYLKKDSLTLNDIAAVNASDAALQQAKAILLYMYSNNINESYLKKASEYFNRSLDYGYNPDFDPRGIVGDDYNNINEKYYGNNHVQGPDAKHGTHVAGIIAANRQNSIGISGVADNVKIMAIRAIPNGDERDKDVANAIYYAVDNGAKIINMSFGKAYSPHKAAVDAAIAYAASKGVLLVHAAGNDAQNIDVENNYPQINIKSREAKNWITVGASSWQDSTHLAGSFSNYGKQSVDLFAPGVDIYSTVPQQKYELESGTSMASPVTAGTAALLWSYYPNLTVEQVKEILMKSTTKFTNLKVVKPAEASEKKDAQGELVKFEELSATGGVVNAYEAVKMAEKIANK